MTAAHPPCAIGIDYKARSLNLAVVRGRQVVYQDEAQLGRSLPGQIGMIATALERVQRFADHPPLIVMERRFTQVGKGVASAALLHETAIRVECLALCAQMLVVWVPVNTWHKQVLGNGGLKSAAGKEAAKEYVERVYGLKPANDDAADAICLAQWGCWQQRVGAVA